MVSHCAQDNNEPPRAATNMIQSVPDLVFLKINMVYIFPPDICLAALT